MVNDKKQNGIMEKKRYITPLSEIIQLGSDVVMKELGPASVPGQMGNAPKRRADVF